MKITEQERKRISKLYNLKEYYPGSYEIHGDINEPDDSGRSDAELEQWTEETFEKCLDDINYSHQQLLDKSDFMKLLDAYYSKNENKDFSGKFTSTKKDDVKTQDSDEPGEFEELPF